MCEIIQAKEWKKILKLNDIRTTLVYMAWVTHTSVKAPLMLNDLYKGCGEIYWHPRISFLGRILLSHSTPDTVQKESFWVQNVLIENFLSMSWNYQVEVN